MIKINQEFEGAAWKIITAHSGDRQQYWAIKTDPSKTLPDFSVLHWKGIVAQSVVSI